MVETNFSRKLKAKLAEGINAMAFDLADGHAADFAAYRYQCGIVEGLRIAVGYCDTLEKEYD